MACAQRWRRGRVNRPISGVISLRLSRVRRVSHALGRISTISERLNAHLHAGVPVEPICYSKSHDVPPEARFVADWPRVASPCGLRRRLFSYLGHEASALARLAAAGPRPWQCAPHGRFIFLLLHRNFQSSWARAYTRAARRTRAGAWITARRRFGFGRGLGRRVRMRCRKRPAPCALLCRPTEVGSAAREEEVGRGHCRVLGAWRARGVCVRPW